MSTAASAPSSLLNAALVRVSTRGGRLRVHPQRAGDVTVHHVWNRSDASPVRPHQVIWVVDLASPDERLFIEIHDVPDAAGRPRHPFPNHRPSPLMCSGAGTHLLESGEPDVGPGPGRQAVCKYDVWLERAHGEVERLDPAIVIVEDP